MFTHPESCSAISEALFKLCQIHPLFLELTHNVLLNPLALSLISPLAYKHNHCSDPPLFQRCHIPASPFSVNKAKLINQIHLFLIYNILQLHMK